VDENGHEIPHLSFPKLEEGGFKLLERMLIDNRDIKLVIIDPLGKTMSSNTRSTHDYKVEYEFLGKLQQLALKYKISVLVVHHDKKGDAKSRDQLILGTTAFAAAPDILLSLWKEGNDGILHINGRGVKEKKYYLFMRNGSWESSNKKIELGISPEQKEIYKHFEKCKGGVFQNKMIARLVKKSSANVSKMLKALERKKLIEEISFGKYRLVA
jgi:RecA-family ATPase